MSNDFIVPGETNTDRLTVTFSLFTSDGLWSTGGSDGNWEGPLITDGGAPTVQYQHNFDAPVSAHNAIVHRSGIVWSYTFDPATEADAGKSEGDIAVIITKVGYRDQVVRVPFRNPNHIVEGLLHRWSLVDGGAGLASPLYDGNVMLSGRLRVFATETARAAAGAGHADNADGEIKRFRILSTALSGKMATYTLVEQL